MLLILYGKTGSGKNYLADKLVNEYGYKYIVRPTSRPKRDYDESDIYKFFTMKEFDILHAKQKIIFPKTFNNWRYGIFSTISELASQEEGKYILVGDKGMAFQVADYLSGNCIVAEVVADMETRKSRAIGREDNPDVEEVLRRLGTDEIDYDNIERTPDVYYDSTIENEIENQKSFLKVVAEKVERNDRSYG